MDEEKTLYCHKDLTQLCKKTECPMWFVPPNPEASGDCSEALNEKQKFWGVIKTATDEMRAEYEAEKAKMAEEPAAPE